MAVEKVDIQKFLSLAGQHPVLDVRSPGEYQHAHIPGAFSLPLFSDEQRSIIGTTYKQDSRESAILTGLDFFGPKMSRMIREVTAILQVFYPKTEDSSVQQAGSKGVVLTHCWRGGMRSAGVSWLLDLYGFKVYSLGGGYRAYRNWVLDSFTRPFPFRVLGGYTGTGKTKILQELNRLGEFVLDLEGIAHHRGSAFGGIGMEAPPSQEMFENQLAAILSVIMERGMIMEKEEPVIWMEDESQSIGPVIIPEGIWRQKLTAPVIFLELPFERRLENLMLEYGKMDRGELEQALLRIRKRLGGQNYQLASKFLLEDNLLECFRILLNYYDKYYLKSHQKKPDSMPGYKKIHLEKIDPSKMAEILLSTNTKPYFSPGE